MRRLAVTALVLATIAGITAGYASDYVGQSGYALYGRFCASCHGHSGQGDGPVAALFKERIPDLTLLAQRNGGVYPYERIEKIIDGRFVVGAHGTRTMPVWGEDFSRMELGNPEAEEVSRILIGRIADHLWTLQKAPPRVVVSPPAKSVQPLENVDPPREQRQ